MKGFLIAVLLIAVLLGGAWALGWLSFSDSPSDTSIHIDKPKVKQDAKQAEKAAKETAEEAVEAAKKAVGEVKSATEKADRKVQDSRPKDSGNEQEKTEKPSSDRPTEPAREKSPERQ